VLLLPSASSDDLTLRVWDAHTHVAIACLTGSTSSITSPLFSPAAAHIAAASSDASIQLWSTSSGAATVNITRRSSAGVCCMAWSSDEALLAAGACDGSVCVWEAAAGLQRSALQCPEVAAVADISLSPGGRLLAAAVRGAAACVYVFDLASSALLALPALRDAAVQLQWSADGLTLADDQGVLWNAR
jgi:WD40 repeat protein